jgi:hypothetical protein
MHKLETNTGSRIESAIHAAITEAASTNDEVEFDFNGVTVQVARDSDSALILRDWWRGMLRPSNTFTVTPHPPAELSAEQLSEDARLTAEREERTRIANEEYAKREAAKTAALNEALASAPPLALKDKARWQEYVDANKDGGYGEACVRYAEKWARLMQARISGITESAHVTRWLVDNADECSHVADDEGITGFMYGAAVAMLSQCWIHGEELRRWHNLKTQIGSEGEKANENGGVLSPAVMTIG